MYRVELAQRELAQFIRDRGAVLSIVEQEFIEG
jgi:hypothetical protein